MLKIYCGRMVSHKAIGPFPLAIAWSDPNNILYTVTSFFYYLQLSINHLLARFESAGTGKCRFIHLTSRLGLELCLPSILHLPVRYVGLYSQLFARTMFPSGIERESLGHSVAYHQTSTLLE